MTRGTGTGTLRCAGCGQRHDGNHDCPQDPDHLKETHVSEYGDRLADAAKIMQGEADELAARDERDDHLNDVIDGLRHHADEIEAFLEEEYYR